MRLVSRPGGAIHGLIRERHPFAALAILAALLPTLLIGVGLHGAATPRFAEGGRVICTASGFEPVAPPAGTGGHGPADCCETGCVHGLSKLAVGPDPVREPVPVAFALPVTWTAVAGAGHHGPAAARALIRAPPVVSV